LLVSLVYLLFRRALAVAALRLCSHEFKELEIMVLRHELAVFRRQVARPRLDDGDRVFLAAAGRFLRGTRRQSLFVRPDTLMGESESGFRTPTGCCGVCFLADSVRTHSLVMCTCNWVLRRGTPRGSARGF